MVIVDSGGAMNKELKKGIIDIIILSILSKNDSYGYELAKIIKNKSNGLYPIKEGTLYAAFKRLEAKNYVTNYWVHTKVNNKRKYYKITSLGKIHLDENMKEFSIILTLINIFKEV